MLQQISQEVFGIHFPNFGSIVYLIKLENKNILIDTSSKENKEELISSLKELNLTPEDITTIILTHAHYDHVENINLFPNAKIYGNFTKKINTNHSQTEIKNILPIEQLPNSIITKDTSGRVVYSAKQGEVEENKFTIYNLPGHTPGDIAILYKDILFSGDIIFHGGYIGRNDFPESNPQTQQESLKKLNKITFDILCPGH